MNVAQANQLRALALALTRGDRLLRPWIVQTSNSFRRIGTDEGDGDVLCATIQRSDGHPDLHARPGVLDYIVAAHPLHVLELIGQRDRAWLAIDYLSCKIAGHDEVFAEAGAIRLGGVATEPTPPPPPPDAAAGALIADEIAAAETLFTEAWEGRMGTGSAVDLAEVIQVARRAITALAAMTAARDEACNWIADRSSEDSLLVARLRAAGKAAP